jgi:hypothetical protein
MQSQRHCAELGATAASTLQLMEEAQKGNNQTRARLRADAWFDSVKAA